MLNLCFNLLCAAFLMSVIVQEEEVSDKEKNTGNQCDLNGKRIILGEDNEMNLEIAVTVLEKAGLKIDTAENGQEACNLFLASPSGTYDFILMDVQMPVMNGYEATKKIRKSNIRKQNHTNYRHDCECFCGGCKGSDGQWNERTYRKTCQL